MGGAVSWFLWAFCGIGFGNSFADKEWVEKSSPGKVAGVRLICGGYFLLGCIVLLLKVLGFFGVIA